MMQRRHLLLALALMGTLLAVYFAPTAEAPVVAAVSRPAAAPPEPSAVARRPAQKVASAETVMPLRTREHTVEDEPRLFAIRSWHVPQAAAPVAPVPPALPIPPPSAPPVPVKLMGRYQEGGKTLLFALYNNQSVVLRVGESLGAEWRVDAVDANQATLTHLPSGQKQSLPWTAAP